MFAYFEGVVLGRVGARIDEDYVHQDEDEHEDVLMCVPTSPFLSGR